MIVNICALLLNRAFKLKAEKNIQKSYSKIKIRIWSTDSKQSLIWKSEKLVDSNFDYMRLQGNRRCCIHIHELWWYSQHVNNDSTIAAYKPRTTNLKSIGEIFSFFHWKECYQAVFLTFEKLHAEHSNCTLKFLKTTLKVGPRLDTKELLYEENCSVQPRLTLID